MDTNLALRQQVLRLVSLGITQKAIGTRMGLSEYQMSRWLNTPDAAEPRFSAMDGLRQFLDALKDEVTRDVTRVTEEEHARLMTEHASARTGHSIMRRTREAAQRRKSRKTTKRGRGLAQR